MSDSLFDCAPNEITYLRVDEFLKERHREGERIEYKGKMSNDVVDTLVSMSNGSDTGLMFIGVEEKRPHNIPTSWPALDSNKNHEGTVSNFCASSTAPYVRPEVFKLEAPDDPAKCVVLVRIRPGPGRPYTSRDKGALIRVGDQDRPADQKALEDFFRRRYEEKPQRERFASLLKLSAQAAGGNGAPACCVVTVPEAYGVLLRQSETLDLSVNGVLRSADLMDVWNGRHREADGLCFQIGDTFLLRIHWDGACYFWATIGAANQDMSVMVMARQLLRVLRFLLLFYPSVADYYEAILLGVTVGPLPERLAWPNSPEVSPVPSQIGMVAARYVQDDTLRLVPSDSPVAVMRQILKKVAYHMQYEGYEALFDRFGRALPDA